MRDGRAGEFTFDAAGRLEHIAFPERRQQYWISYVNQQSRRIAALSYFDVKAERVRTTLALRPFADNRDQGKGFVLIVDPELDSLREMLFNPENFDLDWDYLFAALRTPQSVTDAYFNAGVIALLVQKFGGQFVE